MSIDAKIRAALTSLVNGRVYPDVAEINTTTPYITYQQVGGDAINYLEGGIIGKRNARIQINVWSKSRLEASELSERAEDAMRLDLGLQTDVLGARIARYEEDTKLRGTMQDFSVWY